MSRRFALVQVDVFTETPLGGNPLAVVPEAEGLSAAEMQAIAREMNLSETTFVLPAEAPGADYRVRIFTPESELPFAGHPTLGTAHVMVESGRVKSAGESFTVHQQTRAGVQAIDVVQTPSGTDYTMTLPTPRFAPAPALDELCGALRIEASQVAAEPLTVSVGVSWHIVPLAGLAVVRELAPDMTALSELEQRTGIATTVFCREADAPECSVRLRSFAPGDGIPEDPVCGSGNGCVGAFQVHTGLASAPLAYVAEQGIEVGRPGRASVQVQSGDAGYVVRVGGRVVTVVEGALTL